MAAAARSGVYPNNLFLDDPASSRIDKINTIDRFRQNDLDMFHDHVWEKVGTRWLGHINNHTVNGAVHWQEISADAKSGIVIRHFDGCIEDTANRMKKGQIAVLDESNKIVGLAEYSFIEKARGALMSIISPINCFDGYVKEYDPSNRYVLANLDFDHSQGYLVSSFNPH